MYKPVPVILQSADTDGKDGKHKAEEKAKLAAELEIARNSVVRRESTAVARRNRQTMRDFTKSMLNPDSDPQVDLIKVMVESYMKIVGKNFRDMTPKYIMLKLVEHVRLTNPM